MNRFLRVAAALQLAQRIVLTQACQGSRFSSQFPGMLTDDQEHTASNHPDQRRMLDVLRHGLKRATHVDIAVSFLRFSGLALLVDDFRQCLARGARMRVLTSTYLDISQPDAVAALVALLGSDAVRVHDTRHPGFHQKVYLLFAAGSGAECWVGSSNLTKGGLVSNLELNLRHTAPGALDAVRADFERAWNHPANRVPDATFLDAWRTHQLLSASRLAPMPVSQPIPGTARTHAVAEGLKSYNPGSPVASGPTPNEAQREALERLDALRQAGERRAIIIAAPGIGKTFLAAFHALRTHAGSVLFVSHRLEHLRQAERTFAAVMPDRTTTLADGTQSAESAADLVFASIQTLSRRPQLASQRFDLLVIDEFHHASAPSYRTLIDTADATFILGLTATPERQDGHDVLRLCDYNVAWEIRLADAIRRRWLLPFHYFGVADDTVDLQSIPWRNGQFDPTALENALLVTARVELALRHALEKGFDGPRRATVGFCAGIRHAQFMADAFRTRGLHAVAVTGATPIDRREALYRDFADPHHPLEWLFVADVLNEGVDIPAINSLLFLRPTDSATIFIQQLGRGLRLHSDCEVLTVVDLVGHHRRAWLSLEVLRDPQALPGPSSLLGYGAPLTPPPDCELVLDDVTKRVLTNIAAISRSRRDRCIDAWQRIRAELGEPPYPVDFIGRHDDVEPDDFRSVFGDWIDCRKALGDAEPWETALSPTHPLRVLLNRCEQNWQSQRVFAQALLWAHVSRPDDPDAAYAAFFERFPRWRIEVGDALSRGKAPETLAKKLGSIWLDNRLDPRIFEVLESGRLLEQVEKRLQYQLERDFRTRHGGVLRTPEALVRWQRYRRPEIVNHFGTQYDPARHNFGVLTFNDGPHAGHIAILTKLDTSTAKSDYHYENTFEDAATFRWQSQNRNTPDTEPGRRLVTPGAATIHLFVQERSHATAIYCGAVTPIAHSGSKPITVLFRLPVPVPAAVLAELGVT